MENQTKQVLGSRQAALQAIAEGKPNQEDVLTSMVSLRTSQLLDHLGIHYAHENPLALGKLQEEQEKEEAAKERQALLYQSLSSEELGGQNPTGKDALFAAAGNLAKVDALAEKKREKDEQVSGKIASLNIQNLETQKQIIDDFLKYMNSAGKDYWNPEGNRADFEKFINDLKEWFKGDKSAEAMISDLEHTALDHWNEYSGWWWFGGYGFYNSIFKNHVLPEMEDLLEKALEMPSPFQQALDKAMEKLQKADEKELAFIQALQIKVAEGTHATGQDAVFESAALVSEVTDDAQRAELNDLEKRVKELEQQLQNLVKMEKLLVMYTNAIQQFQKTHNFGDFFKVLLVLFSEFGGNPGVRQELNKVLKEGIGAFFESKMDGIWWFPENWIWDEFANSIGSTLDNIEKSNMNDPALAGLFLSQGKKAFDKIIKETMKSIDEMEQIIRFIEEDKGENAIFLMEQEIMQMEAVALKSNANQNKVQEKESEANIQNLEKTLNKINDALKKLEKAQHHHHHGIFGWVEDLVDSIKDLICKICDLVKDICTGNFHAAAKDFNSIGIVKELKSLFKHLGKMLKDIEHGNFKAALGQLKQVTEIVVEAVILTALFGPAGLMLMGTEFGKDMKDAGTLVLDVVQAAVQIVLAGLAGGKNTKFGAEMLKSDKKLGIEMLENPALKPLLDCVAIALAVVAAAAGQVEVAAIIIGLMILSDTGVMGDIESGLTKMFEAMGCSKDVAKVLADVTVVVVITALTLGAGSAEAATEEVGDEIAEEGAEEGSEEGSELADGVKKNETELKLMNAVGDSLQNASENTASQSSNAAQAAEDAEKTDGILSRAAKAVGRRVGTRAGAGLMGFGMSLGMTNMGVDLAKVIDKKDKELQEILMIVQEVVAAIATIVGGTGVAFGNVASEVSESTESLTMRAARKVSDSLAKYLEENASSLTQLAGRLQSIYMVSQGAYQAMQGGLDMIRGDIIADLKKEQGFYQLVDALQQINLTAMKQTTEHRGNLVKEFDQINDELIKAPGMIAEAQYQVMSQNIV